YLNSAIDVCIELQQRSTKSSLSSLQLITTIGVVAGIIGYLGKDSLPTFTLMGGVYFVLLLILTWIVNACISKIYRHRSYKISINTEKKHLIKQDPLCGGSCFLSGVKPRHVLTTVL
ncbi:hypothetical protein KBB27_01840, partial [Patescibacteria group bacterium]|nr:hypothetical protein [Patescibacteria group bacterium]